MEFQVFKTYFNQNVKKELFYEAVHTYENRCHLFNKRVLINTLEKFDSKKVDEFDIFNDYLNIDKITKVDMIPRNETFCKTSQLIIYDLSTNTITFRPHHFLVDNVKLLIPNFSYQVSYDAISSRINLNIPNVIKETHHSDFLIEKLKWLESFFKQICYLSHNQLENYKLDDINHSYLSLNLIKSEEEFYAVNYQKMKRYYAPALVNDWPLNTDPKKHIFEDIAIAAYIITIWKLESNRLNISSEAVSTGQKKFLDLGCGNGVLTYLLSREGFTGTGIDVRERKTWPLLRNLHPGVDLKETSLNPSDPDCIFPEYEWILGNHCDELTPWIPRLSARNDKRNTKRSNIFLLPCCPFDFYGKYERRDTHLSHYQDYLNYLEELCSKTYGFSVKRDKLRIPSTKRICLVGYPLTTPLGSRPSSPDPSILAKGDHSIVDQPNNTFTPRPKVEAVRNCTQIDRSIIDAILWQAFEAVYQSDPLKGYTVYTGTGCSSHTNNPAFESCCGFKIFWICGDSVDLSDFSRSLTVTQKAALKNQHGGLRTLFRNHQNIFKVRGNYLSLYYDVNLMDVDGPSPSITPPLSQKDLVSKEDSRRKFRKTRMCWFYVHHPQGCPYKSQLCNYAHGTSDILPCGGPDLPSSSPDPISPPY